MLRVAIFFLVSSTLFFALFVFSKVYIGEGGLLEENFLLLVLGYFALFAGALIISIKLALNVFKKN